ncbi:lipoprotein insertase outer membrane protein LolB [Cognatilysobacter bugurensis]|uniref:Outer-membrane lipoprotein LolB n=1 Tax=Cognatilysobacter bugurensis TaxID=543356 RepID=A0A918T4G5_9GAMM|nr:lipoprotein insertase outer membrane protein LolB [Lysobacter bugurensis]GHA89514.1 outer-membrane lipoprotein LolB [Lysobacter bugurensis]
MIRIATVLLSLALAACASAPMRTGPAVSEAAAEAAQQSREVALREDADWTLTGRIAVSNGRDGGSGRLEWRQAGERFEVGLSAPVTRQGWRLSGDAGQARLEGLDGGPRVGADASDLLRTATGWDIPVVALADWVRGARAGALGPATIHYDATGRPARIEQGGWTIDYRWPDAASEPLLPSRVDARRGEARVRLLVDSWGET